MKKEIRILLYNPAAFNPEHIKEVSTALNAIAIPCTGVETLELKIY